MTRRVALQTVAVFVAAGERLRAQRSGTTSRLLLSPLGSEVIEIDFGAGAQTVKTIRLAQGAVHVDVSVSELFAALKTP